ncbi:MAG TPA: permease-like cell division protein FtsX [Candidatus Paceibacterota bacterium]|nr:permease-like cell division protein FtsX [Candidatus Paceibacterota bacterium]
MFWVNVKRVTKSGWTNFRRNGLVTYASVLVTTITLSVVTALFLFQAVLHSMLNGLQNQVDVAVYFTADAPEENILSLQKTLQELPEVQSVDYVSADQQVLDFRNRHADDYLTLQALDEVGNNPFGGSLRIKAKDPTKYESIVNVLEGDNQIARDNADIIDRINYAQNKVVIDKLNFLVSSVHRVGTIATLILSLISIIIMFTTVRLTIYMVRDEIGVMRLVGASGGYIRMPFIVEGMLYGFFAWLVTFVLFLPVTYLLGRSATNLLGMNLYSYYLSHFLTIGGFVLIVGLVLGSLSSYLAVRKYLNV